MGQLSLMTNCNVADHEHFGLLSRDPGPWLEQDEPDKGEPDIMEKN